ncbi:uncharacterized protein JCM15063_003271 [Sporobolomyces koalae]|uniref:uncharacterized protein n=1 Tax=Sporobolomyces koalae TaxID=500713 RepID=UPI00317655CF
MSPRGSYIPLHQYPSSSSSKSRNLRTDLPPRSLASRCSRSTAGLLAAALVLLLVLYPRKRLTWLQQALQGEGIDYTLGYNELFSTQGWTEYTPSRKIHSAGTTPSSDTWADRLSSECRERLVEQGDICTTWQHGDATVGALWTWANGTDPLLSVWKAEVTAHLTGEVSAGIASVRAAKRARHFRDHDELKYSIRSALAACAPSVLTQLSIVTTDLPAHVLLRDTLEQNATVDLESDERIGQIPTWLSHGADMSEPRLSIIHHSDFFANRSVLPTFNSLSIESQLPRLQNFDSEFFLYLNDDTFLLGSDSITETDMGAPVIGTVFRLQSDLTVDSLAPTDPVYNPEGEWASLRRANWLLDRRFGQRRRQYLAHIPKAMSMPILREVGTVWQDELEQTASSRFRGRQTEYQLAFLATHYQIESHRQALLHAFLFGRIDANGDGSLSLSERHALLDQLGFERNEDRVWTADSRVFAPFRSTKRRLSTMLAQADLRPPRSTTFTCTSMDGYCPYRGSETSPDGPIRPIVYDEREPQSTEPFCILNWIDCFGRDFLSGPQSIDTNEVFRQITYERTHCGDCMIVQLVSTSGPAGLSAFLPPDRDQNSPATLGDRHLALNLRRNTHGALIKHHSDFVQTGSPLRNEAIREILRYSYSLGDSSSRFHGMTSPRDLERFVQDLEDESNDRDRKPTTFLTLNDDFPNDHVSEMTQPLLDDLFKRTWPVASPYEL